MCVIWRTFLSMPKMIYWQVRTSVGTLTAVQQCQQISLANRPTSNEEKVLEE